jgi:hypothetical protein
VVVRALMVSLEGIRRQGTRRSRGGALSHTPSSRGSNMRAPTVFKGLLICSQGGSGYHFSAAADSLAA